MNTMIWNLMTTTMMNTWTANRLFRYRSKKNEWKEANNNINGLITAKWELL